MKYRFKPFQASITKRHGSPIVTLSYVPNKTHEKPLAIKIAPGLGSNMFSMTYGAHEIIYHNPSLLPQYGFTGNFVLFPTPNRVTNFAYTWNGKRIVMKKRGKIVKLHGLVFDEPWQYKKPKIYTDHVTVETSISITKTSAMYEAFPFPCRLALRYTVRPAEVRITYTVTNLGHETLPFGFALHPYFVLLSGKDKTLLTVPTRSWMEAPDQTLLPTGKRIDVAGKPYDLRAPVPVGQLDLDHVFTDILPRRSATINYSTLGLRIHLKTSKDFTHFVVYTRDEGVVCVENQTCSTDAHNLWAKGLKKESHLLTVAPGRSHTGFIRYEIEDRK